MILFPAIDLRGGRCVRLRQGDPQAETVFGDDPAAMARRWAGLGATWLHVVNLDGAFGDERAGAVNLRALRAILESVAIPVQFGGGLRTADDLARLFDMGVRRVILGTAIVDDPHLVADALARFGPERIVAGIDARDGHVAIRGWRHVTEVDAVALGCKLRDQGIQRVVYTDIARDGTLGGPNLEATARLARETGLRVIASGGISSLEELSALCQLEPDGIEGAIIGRALYTGAIELSEALEVCNASQTYHPLSRHQGWTSGQRRTLSGPARRRRSGGAGGPL